MNRRIQDTFVLTVLYCCGRYLHLWTPGRFYLGALGDTKEPAELHPYLGQASHVQVEADDEDVPGDPQSGPYRVLG